MANIPSQEAGLRQPPLTSTDNGGDNAVGPQTAQKNKPTFSCPQCGLQLASFANVQRHQKTVHSDVRPFFCPVEGCKWATLGYARKDALQFHMKTRHANEKIDYVQAFRQERSKNATLISELEAWKVHADNVSKELDESRMVLYQQRAYVYHLNRELEAARMELSQARSQAFSGATETRDGETGVLEGKI